VNLTPSADGPILASDLLQRFGAPTDHFTLAWLMGNLHKRSFGAIMLIWRWSRSLRASR
jgi:hypothetical protein